MLVGLDSEQRFGVLYEEQHPAVLAFFMRRLDRDDAVEAAADVFVAAWRRIDEVPQGAEGRLWLFGVARNVLRNRQRGVRRWSRLVAKVGSLRGDGPPIPEAVVVHRAEDDAVIDALLGLRERDREVVLMRLWEEASYDDIASILGCSRHAAEQRYAKALRRLRSVVQLPGHEWVSDQQREQPDEA